MEYVSTVDNILSLTAAAAVGAFLAGGMFTRDRLSWVHGRCVCILQWWLSRAYAAARSSFSHPPARERRRTGEQEDVVITAALSTFADETTTATMQTYNVTNALRALRSGELVTAARLGHPDPRASCAAGEEECARLLTEQPVVARLVWFDTSGAEHEATLPFTWGGGAGGGGGGPPTLISAASSSSSSDMADAPPSPGQPGRRAEKNPAAAATRR